MSPRRSTESRKAAYRRGLRAERIARWLLKLKGYELLAERYQNTFGEVDIIVKKGDVLVLVEVKARSTFRACMESITPNKQARQIKAAKSLLAYPGKLAPHIHGQLTVRFDMVCVVPWHIPKHLTNAWQER